MQPSAQTPPFTRPRLGIADVGVLLWRSKWLMMLIFFPIALTGIFLATTLPTTYFAHSRVLVSLSDEYVFRPSVGENIQNSVPELEQLIQTEIDIMRSPVVADRVMEKLGLERLYPKIAIKLASASADETYKLSQTGLNSLQDDFTAFATPKKAVIEANFGHEDPQIAADTLNEILAAYTSYRAEIFEDQAPKSFERQRRRFEDELMVAEEDMRQFLQSNGIGDFEAERAATQSLFASVEQAVLDNATRQSELDGQLAILRQQLLQTAPEVDLFIEDSSAQSLVTLELEREELLTRYTPGSQALQDINERIARARQYLASRNGNTGTTRRGPNPLYQSLQTSVSTVGSQAAATRQQQIELVRQSASVATRQRRIAALEPQWQELVRRRDLLESNARSFAAREVEARTLAEISDQGADNIRILEPARRPTEGSSLKVLAALGAIFFGLFSALVAGFLRALTRRGFATPASLERTTGLPVVSTVRKYG